MLTQIVDDIRAAGRPLCAAELSRHLDIDETALEGMLETLVRRQRLRAIVPDADDCAGGPHPIGAVNQSWFPPRWDFP